MKAENDYILRSTKLLKICHLMPKTELHAHLNGSIRKTTLFELSSEEDREVLCKLYQNQMSFENAFKVFRISSKIVKDLEVIKRITSEMIEDWVKVNCIYLEIRTSIKAINGKTKEDYLRTVLNEIQIGNEKYEMQTRLIISFNRELSIEDYMDTLEVYNNFNEETKNLIVGIDYSGYETNERHTYEEVTPIFELFRSKGLKVTVHMGETEDPQYMDYNKFRPDRISHTYFFSDDQVELIMKNKIPIEICPTGSYSAKNLNSYKEINLRNYHNKVVIPYSNPDETFIYDLFCINTDDTMLFTTDLSQEYFEVATHFNIEAEDLKAMVLRSINFIFESDEAFRKVLREKINNFII